MLRSGGVNFRFLVARWMALCSALLVLPVLVIRAQPYDDSPLRAVMTPPQDCPAPCFMGIQPGVTSTRQALRMLERHDWIARFGDRQRSRDVLMYLSWEWNDSHPYLPPGPLDNNLTGAEGTINSISVQTTIPLVELWWLYGPPYWMQRAEVSQDQTFYFFAYPEEGLVVSVAVSDCDRLTQVLTGPTRLTFASWIFDKPERFLDTYFLNVRMDFFKHVNPCIHPPQFEPLRDGV